MILMQPTPANYSRELLSRFEQIKNLIVNIRSTRQAKGISPKEPLELFVKGDFPEDLFVIVQKMANVSSLRPFSQKGDSSSGASFMVDTTEFFIPLGGLVNIKEEIDKIVLEINHLEGFLAAVNSKLSNTKFVSSAPKAVVDLEMKKQNDAQTKISKLTQLMSELNK